MPTPRNPYPYNMSWSDLKPEPRPPGDPTYTLDPNDVLNSLNWLRESALNPDDELDRVFDAALALAMRMTLDPEHSELTRGQILRIAIDTAITWERG